MSRSKIFIVAFLVVSVAIQLWVQRTERSSRQLSRPKEGAAAPALSLTDINGSPVALQDFRGKVVILDFWATWCGPCMAEFGVLGPWWKQQLNSGAADNVVLLAVNVQEPRDTVRRFLEKSPLPFMVLLDEDASVAGKYGVEVLPTLVIIDRNGAIVDQTRGYDPSVGNRLSQRLQALAEQEQTP